MTSTSQKNPIIDEYLTLKKAYDDLKETHKKKCKDFEKLDRKFTKCEEKWNASLINGEQPARNPRILIQHSSGVSSAASSAQHTGSRGPFFGHIRFYCIFDHFFALF